MTTKEILHEILLGMDGHACRGVPDNYWSLATRLCQKVYGDKGVALLESAHKTYVQQYDDCNATLHMIGKCEGSKTYIGPAELIERLEKLGK